MVIMICFSIMFSYFCLVKKKHMLPGSHLDDSSRFGSVVSKGLAFKFEWLLVLN